MSDLIKSRFGAFTPAREVVAGMDLTGRTVIVTGAASGIGWKIAEIFRDIKKLPPRPQWLSSSERPVSALPPVEVPRRQPAGVAAATEADAPAEKAPRRRPSGQARPATA